MPKLSIITVCKNAENDIEKTIQSVISQSYLDYEYIIIDGESSDGTLEVINKYKEYVNILISEKDSGIYDAMNKGIAHASGEYLNFLNAGDYYVNSNAVDRVFDIGIDADILYGDTLILHKGKYIRKPASNKVTPFFMFKDTIPHQNAFIKRELFSRVGIYDTKFKIAGDYEFFLRSFLKHGITPQYFGFPIAVNILNGVSADKKNKKITFGERMIAQNKLFENKYLLFFRLINPLVNIFIKYPRYSVNILLSLISKKYLRIGDN